MLHYERDWRRYGTKRASGFSPGMSMEPEFSLQALMQEIRADVAAMTQELKDRILEWRIEFAKELRDQIAGLKEELRRPGDGSAGAP